MTTTIKITTKAAALAARDSTDPAIRAAADAYFARRNQRAAREAGRPLSRHGRTAQLARGATVAS